MFFPINLQERSLKMKTGKAQSGGCMSQLDDVYFPALNVLEFIKKCLNVFEFMLLKAKWQQKFYSCHLKEI